MHSEQALTKPVQIRFTPSEYDVFRSIALRMNMPVSAVVRWAALSWLIVTDSRYTDAMKPMREINPDAKIIDLLKPLREIDPDVDDVDQDVSDDSTDTNS